MRALDRKVIRDLGRLRGQMVAVALVVCCGVATFVAMRSSYGALLATRAAYYDEYRFADVFAHVKRAPATVARQLEEIPGVERVEARVVAEVTLDVPRLDEPATGRLVSVPTGREPGLNALFLRSGEMPSRARPDDVVASEAFAGANGLRVGDTLGAVVNGRWRRLRVCGVGLSPEYVYEIRGAASILPDNRRFGVLWMGEEALAAAFDLTGAFNDVALSLAPGASEAEVLDRVDAVLDRYGGTLAYGREDQVSHRFLADEIRAQRTSGYFSPAIFLGVAAFLLHLVMTRLVGTQREQIAVLKSFGYSDVTIGWHYTKLALAAVAVGTAAGTPLGLWLGRMLADLSAEFYRFPVLVFGANGAEIALGVAVTAAAAWLGTVSAVRRAVALPPAEAMRPAAPAVFRPLFVERLNLHHLISPATRMLLRNLERRPGRALISILGIALAVGIVVMGRSMFDAVDYMSDVQFRDVQRDDATVAFVEPLPESALSELAHLPGVFRAEPFRAVAVELSNGHRARRVSLLGLRRGADLRRVVALDRRAVAVPDEGVLLTSRLAELLGTAPGRRIRVRVLEGERRERELAVAAVVDEPMGLNAYMDDRALARLLGEQGAISGAFLEVDPREEPALFRELKATPAVGGVSLRSATMESFEKTISRNMAISGTTIFVFAIIIAAAVVYNGARIALSERQHELASLRVLGFTFREVGMLLFGEQLILTAAAMPVGFALGWLFSAWIRVAVASDLVRFPIGTDPSDFAVAFLIVGAASVLSGLMVWRRVRQIDMVEALKVRE
jgi:putative ABC transport system permease protein